MSKKLNYFLSPESLEDLQSLYFFLTQNYEEEVFFEIKNKINDSIKLIRDFPEIGQEASLGVRIFPISKTKYILVFRVEKKVLEIVRIFHTSQKGSF